MKKILSLVLALMMLATLVLCSCGKTADDKKTDDGKKSDVYEIAVVTDVGQLMDKGFNQGTYEVKVMPDGWTVKTLDGKLSAHYENTVLITNGEPEILTTVGEF